MAEKSIQNTKSGAGEYPRHENIFLIKLSTITTTQPQHDLGDYGGKIILHQ